MNAKSEDDERLDQAVRYTRSTFGDKAEEEVEKGLAYAKEVNNELAIEAFSAILIKLRLSGEGDESAGRKDGEGG